jgi:hypothetical protein
MTLRDELLAAIDHGDHIAVRRGAFGPVWESLTTSNAPKQGCTLSELRPYANLLGDESRVEVLRALEACAGSWRPGPGEVRAT